MSNNSSPSPVRPVSASLSLDDVYRQATRELMNACSFFCETDEVPRCDRPTLLKIICGLFRAVSILERTFETACPAEPETLCRYQPPPSPVKPKR
jgi:hypothetical protein